MFLAVSGIMWTMSRRDASEDLDWERLAQYVISGRVRLGHRVRGAFAGVVGISERILGDIEKARRSNYDPTTLAQLEQALGWRTGSLDSVLRGGEPVVLLDQADRPAGDRAVVLQVIAILQTDFRPETKLTMIQDVIDRDFVPEPAAGASEERLAS